ncbi:MAG: acyl carrier protein [Bacteroidia bacterium]
MSEKEILNQIEEVLELDENTLKKETELSNIEEFDSMAKLSLIVMSDDDFGKKLTAEQINDFVTVGDIVKFLS